MPTLPKAHDSLIQAFAPHFSNCIWQHAQVLLIGAILVPGRRTVTAVLRIMGLSQERQFQSYHRCSIARPGRAGRLARPC